MAFSPETLELWDAQESHPYGRPAEIEEYSNRYFIHPLSRLVVQLALKWCVSPNALSLTGLGFGLVAAAFYNLQPDRGFVIAGFICMLIWHVFDGADGLLARINGTSSAFGRLIDGICDHLVYFAVYFSIYLYLVNSGAGPEIWVLVLAAGASHGVQAAAYEERRQRFHRRLNGAIREDTNERVIRIGDRRSNLAALYDWAQRLVGGDPSELDHALGVLRDNPAPPLSATELVYRTTSMVRVWALLNANNRTFMIALMCFIGQPALYFAFELIVLNVLMLVLVRFEKKHETGLARMAAGLGPGSLS